LAAKRFSIPSTRQSYLISRSPAPIEHPSTPVPASFGADVCDVCDVMPAKLPLQKQPFSNPSQKSTLVEKLSQAFEKLSDLCYNPSRHSTINLKQRLTTMPSNQPYRRSTRKPRHAHISKSKASDFIRALRTKVGRDPGQQITAPTNLPSKRQANPPTHKPPQQ
jgi:hypothetical protein